MYHVTTATPIAEYEDITNHVQAALEADDNAKDHLPMTAAWEARIEAYRATERAARKLKAKATATKQVAVVHLAEAGEELSYDLLAAVKADRTSARWSGVFWMRVSAYVRLGAAAMVGVAGRWLARTDEPVIEEHRPKLAKWHTCGEQALKLEVEAKNAKTGVDTAEERLVAEFNRDLDALRGSLLVRQAETHQPSGWADAMFPIHPHKTKKPAADPPATPPAA